MISIGPYLIGEPLGCGSMGIVYRAVHAQTGQPVALKTVRLPSKDLLQSLRREIHALRGIRHPGIVSILDEGVHEGLPWYTMELLEGVSLRCVCSRDKLLPVRSVVELARRLCASLAFLHGEGIVHGDLKPDNILISGSREWAVGSREAQKAAHPSPDSLLPTPSAAHPTPNSPLATPAAAHPTAHSLLPTAFHNAADPTAYSLLPTPFPVLVDFGLVARFTSELSRESLEEARIMTGTVSYMAPEQISGDLLDARADLYALGCVLYELLTGQPPFRDQLAARVIRAHMKTPPLPPSTLASGVPPQLDEVVLRLLAKRTRDRFGHADDVATALGMVHGEELAPTAGPKPRAFLYRPGFAGRDDVFRTLKQALEPLDQGSGGIVLIGGESGVGKTRLLVELGREAEQRGARVLTGECLPPPGGFDHGGSRPLQALAKPLQFIADHCLEAGHAEAERLLGRNRGLLARYQPALRRLPSAEVDETADGAWNDNPSMPIEAARARLFACVAETFTALARERPLLILLDDLHWVDELTAGLLESWISTRSLDSTPILVVGTYRSEEPGPRVRALLEATAAKDGVLLHLGRLEASAVASMVGEMLALNPVPEVFSNFLTRRSEGNPFFVAEYLRTALAEGVLFRDEVGRWQVAEHGEEAATLALYETLPLPGSVRGLVGRRLEGLSGPARRLAQIAAVLGREWSAELLTEVAQSGGTEALEGVNELLARQVVEELQPGLLRFAHDQIREVAYEAIDREGHRLLHERAAQVLESHVGSEPDRHLAALGHHWDQAGSAGRARHWYLAAARQARDRYAQVEAERLYKLGLRMQVEPSVASVEAHLELAHDILHLQGLNQAAEVELAAALQTARAIGARVVEAKIVRALGSILYDQGRLEEARHHFQQAFELFHQEGDRSGQARTWRSLATILWDEARLEESQAIFERVLALYREIRNRSEEGITLTNLAVLHRDQGRLDRACEMNQEALAVHRETGNRTYEGMTLSNLAIVLRAQLKVDRAREAFEQALAVHREVRNRRSEGITLGNLGLVYADLGQVERARTAWDQARELAREVGPRRLEGVVLLERAGLERRLGQLESAGRLLDESEAILRTVGDRLHLALLTCERGHLALASGRAMDGLEDAEAEIVRSLRPGPETELGLALHRLRRAGEAFEAGHALLRGECPEDVPAGLRHRLLQAGELRAEVGTES